MNEKDYNNHNGYAALISVLIAGAIGVAVATSLLVFGVGVSRTTFSREQSGQAQALADACSEEALQQIRDATVFSGTGSLTLGQGTCIYTVTSQGGSNRTVTASGTVGATVRRVRVIINAINPTMSLVSWQEVADF
ncbi:hypothetical protein HY623_01890 [Candidatus Uhrbacteria bacterium]|nr:hypothetical protein [Candidatus Uhrbacteria bacterium]